MPEVAGDCPKISLGEFFLDASVPNGPNYNTPELIGDLKKLTGPSIYSSLSNNRVQWNKGGQGQISMILISDPH